MLDTTNSNIVIRNATKNDIPAILEMVKELAIYEKEPNAVTATLENYYDDFENHIFESCVATLNDQIIGITIYYMTYSTWKGRTLFLEDFIVKQAYRKCGVGQLLFDRFIEEAKQKKCVMAKWQVLEWNTIAINFYKKNNVVFETDWVNVKSFF
ncbi:MAG: GNAT family N-acetyltransferase [Saprospiraceae bacterium]|nr:GNAT family N-acetyltransferase [Saprospiraceae bacterium]